MDWRYIPNKFKFLRSAFSRRRLQQIVSPCLHRNGLLSATAQGRTINRKVMIWASRQFLNCITLPLPHIYCSQTKMTGCKIKDRLFAINMTALITTIDSVRWLVWEVISVQGATFQSAQVQLAEKYGFYLISARKNAAWHHLAALAL